MRRIYAALFSLALLLGISPAFAQTYMSSKTQATSLNSTDSTWWCQTAGVGGASGCASGEALNEVLLSTLTTYIDSQIMSGMAAGQVPIASTGGTVTHSLPLSGTAGATEVASATSGAKATGHMAGWDVNGNLTDIGSATSGGISGLTVGQIPVAGSAATLISSIPLTGVAGATQAVSSTSATRTATDIAVWDANGNLVDGGAVPSGTTGANPSATVGASAVNGVATTWMRSDAAPAIGTNAVSNALLAQASADTIKCNNTASLANELDCSTTQIKTLINTNFTDLAGSASTAQLATNLSPALDSAFGNAQGDLLYRGSSTWVVLPPGTSGTFLETQGAAANPIWGTPSGSGNVLGTLSATAGDFECVTTTANPLASATDCGVAPLLVDETTSGTITATQWQNGDPLVVSTTAQTITFPASSGLTRNGSSSIQALAAVTLTATSDVIEYNLNGVVTTTAASGSITCQAGSYILVTAKVSGTLKVAGCGYPQPVALPTPGTSIALTAPQGFAICTGTCTVTVPIPAAGYEFCIMNDVAVGTAITISNPGSSVRFSQPQLPGTATAYGTATTGTLSSTAAAGNAICLIGRDSTHYISSPGSAQGVWTAS